MAPTHAETAPGGRLHLLNLPAELQTVIFDHAYSREPDISLIDASTWRMEQSFRQHLQGAEYRRFPACKVSDFLVSKAFFVAAARAYVRSQPVKEVNAVPLGEGVLGAFAREVDISYHSFGRTRLPALQVARLDVQLIHFMNAEPEGRDLPMVQKRLARDDFAGTLAVRRVGQGRGLARIELVAEPISQKFDNLTEEQEEIWRANVRVLEEVVTPIVTAPRVDQPCWPMIPSIDHGKAQTPIYDGSSVFFEPATKHPAFKPNYMPDVEGLIDIALGCCTQDEKLHCIVGLLTDVTGAEELRVQTALFGLLQPTPTPEREPDTKKQQGKEQRGKGQQGEEQQEKEQQAKEQQHPKPPNASRKRRRVESNANPSRAASYNAGSGKTIESNGDDKATEDGDFVSFETMQSFAESAAQANADVKRAKERVDALTDRIDAMQAQRVKEEAAYHEEVEEVKVQALEVIVKLREVLEEREKKAAARGYAEVINGGVWVDAWIALVIGVWLLLCVFWPWSRF